MQKKVVKGTTENLNLLNQKVNYIGFELGKVPEFLKEFEPLNYDVPKEYDETTYRVYKYVSIDDIDIFITTNNRLDELGERYKHASPLYTYMESSTQNLEKYAYFLKMINGTKLSEIEEIEKEQENMQDKEPFEVKFQNNYKWQLYYSEYAKRYFMMASTEESDNSTMFYLLKKKIEQHNNPDAEPLKIFVPISNQGYSEKILKRSEIEDIENYLWFFTQNWCSVYEVIDKENKLSLQVVGEAKIFDQMTSKYNLKFTDKKEALEEFKLIKALFILSYEMQSEFKFDTKIDSSGHLLFSYNGGEVHYSTLAVFLKEQAEAKMQENIKVKLETKNLNADIIDLQNKCQELDDEYHILEGKIYNYLESRKTFFGRVKYFFKNNKNIDEPMNSMNKNRLKDILKNDKKEEKPYDDIANDKLYTVEDIIKICKELKENIKNNQNIKLDIEALQNKIDILDRKIKNEEQYLAEIEEHKKSIFEFWKFANKTEVRALDEGEEKAESKPDKLKKTFEYEDDIETLASKVDKKQREILSEEELNATFAANFTLDGINLVSKSELLEKDKQTIQNILSSLQTEYRENIDKIEKKDFDIFGNVAEDKTKIKKLNNTLHRESEKDKFKVLNVNLDTQLDEFTNKLIDIRKILEEESDKIETPYAISIYKASNEVLDTNGFDKFDINPQETLEKIENNSDNNEIYLYKINIPEKTNLIFYSNIVFYNNTNGTLPLGMDISQETLINMDMYNLILKDNEEFNINVSENEFSSFVRKVKVYEYDIVKK